MLTGSYAGITGVVELFARAARIVRVGAVAFMDWVCRGDVRLPTRAAGVLVIVAEAGAAVFLLRLVAAGARGGFVPLPVSRGATIVDGERGGDVCTVRRHK